LAWRIDIMYIYAVHLHHRVDWRSFALHGYAWCKMHVLGAGMTWFGLLLVGCGVGMAFPLTSPRVTAGLDTRWPPCYRCLVFQRLTSVSLTGLSLSKIIVVSAGGIHIYSACGRHTYPHFMLWCLLVCSIGVHAPATSMQLIEYVGCTVALKALGADVDHCSRYGVVLPGDVATQSAVVHSHA
jgi:hypothetical protein